MEEGEDGVRLAGGSTQGSKITVGDGGGCSELGEKERQDGGCGLAGIEA